MDVQLNKVLFNSRLERILTYWKSGSKDEDFGSVADCDALLLLAGDPASEEEPTKKGVAFQTWLLGYEFPTTFLLLKKDELHVLCSAKKAKILSQVATPKSPVPVNILVLAKGKEPATDALPKFLEAYTSSKHVGTLVKEKHTGKMISEWNTAVEGAPTKPKVVDIATAISGFVAVKDEEEINSLKMAGNLTKTLLQHHIAPKLETIVDRQTKISHEGFAALIEARLGTDDKPPDMKVWDKGSLGKVDWQSAEFCYPTIIQSQTASSGYDLKFTAHSTPDNIAYEGVFLVSVGMRYKSYCSSVGRSIMVDPSKEQEAIYGILFNLQTELMGKLQDGIVARDVYQHAISYIREKKPELEQNFVKSIGFGTGQEFRDSVYLLSPKNTRRIRTNMTFILSLGFQDLVDDQGQKYALQLNDTVIVNSKRPATCLTDGLKKPKHVMFFSDDGSEVEDTKASAKKGANGNPSPLKNKTAGGKVLRNKTRNAGHEEAAQSIAAKIGEHQRELHAQLHKNGLAKYSEGGSGAGGKEGQGWKKFQSYKGEPGLPKEVESLRIFVDRKASTIILPIHGFAVPFHINTIKNVSKSEEGNQTLLRINFQTPGQIAGKKEDTPFEDPDATFVRSITYRSTDGHRFDSISKQITDLKKEVTKREQQKKEMAGVIDQDSLIELKGRRPIRLPEVFVRPALDGKRLPGEVEIHQNGLRYQSPMGSQKIDILFSNIKHLFFLPCDHELLVIVHIHLKSPMMIGKRKAHDVQFFREASDVQFDETGNRKRKYRYGDEDEIELEQQERKRRQILNREFKAFAEKVAEAATVALGDTLEMDVPFRELSFEGVPHRTNVRLQPTTDCLVYLSDPPFLVVTLNEIEIASLERVQFGLKQFDMVLVFKDFAKSPLHINSIPTTLLDDVKQWLNSVDIPLAEGPVNLNWNPIMKHVNENPYEFFSTGGWGFLGAPNGEEQESDDGSETESEYEQAPSESDFSEGGASESDFNDGSDASEDEGSGSDFSEGDDWDELERKAAKCE
ncbi:FACT complex subunit SPT16 [Thelephora terrestris]|uniref:FACT complex subunit n=1 Tax=Thelephora terrestris TaxID=56493 RepID=A0A9P6HR70_9AGAM|nr:FACT complex subunit SPT16 [Thelephora terrestris]